MRGVLPTICLFCAASASVAAGLARGEEQVLSYAPIMAPPRSVLTETKPKEDAKHFDLPPGRVCFDPMETRDKIVSHKLTEPFQALRAGRWRGEALRARLCRWAPGKFVYEIAVLRHDGRIIHVYMNAQTGRNVDGPSEPKEVDDPQGE